MKLMQTTFENHIKYFTLEDSIQLDHQANASEKNDEEKGKEKKEIKTLSIWKRREARRHLEMAWNIFAENDSNSKLSGNVFRAIQEAITYYKKFYRSKLESSKQSMLRAFFTKSSPTVTLTTSNY